MSRNNLMKKFGRARKTTSVVALIAAVLLSFSNPAFAATSPTENKENWFQVEVIVFLYESGLSKNTELWHDNLTISYPEDLVVLKQPQPATVLQNNLDETSAATSLTNGIIDADETADSDLATPSDEALSSIAEDAAPEFSQFDASMTVEPSSSHENAILQPALKEIAIDSLPQRLIEPTDLGRTAFALLPQSYFQLSGIKGRIDRALDMRLLAHFAWRQPVDLKSTPVLVQVGNQYGLSSELEGALSLAKNRFLHFDANLFYSTFKEELIQKQMDWEIFSVDQTETAPLDAKNFGMRHEQPFDLLGGLETNFKRELIANFHSKQRIDENKIYYFDHPLFGLLVMVSPHQLPDPVMEMRDFDLDALPVRKELPSAMPYIEHQTKVSELPPVVTPAR